MPETFKTSDLTDDELAALESQGVDTSGPEVVVTPPQPAADEAAERTKKSTPVEAPPPSQAVVDRVRRRVEAQEAMEGSSYEARDDQGRVVEKKGEVRSRTGEPEETPIEQADKQAFLIHMLGAERFTKSYDLFGGRMRVTLQTRTVAEDERCAAQAFADEQTEGFPGNTPEVRSNQRLQRYCDYQFILSLSSLEAEGQAPRVFRPEETVVRDPEKIYSPLQQARTDFNESISQPLKVALRQVHNRFEALTARLAGEASSKDFWTAGSDS